MAAAIEPIAIEPTFLDMTVRSSVPWRQVVSSIGCGYFCVQRSRHSALAIGHAKSMWGWALRAWVSLPTGLSILPILYSGSVSPIPARLFLRFYIYFACAGERLCIAVPKP